jgi:molybdopterin synthase catalytic subunit
MQIRVLFFGVLKDLAGLASETAEFPEGTSVEDVFSHYAERAARLRAMRSSLAFAVNQEYARSDHALRAGDEVGFLPPVSGGAAEKNGSRVEVRVVREPIFSQAVVERLRQPGDGAVVVFDGVVRNHSRGRRTAYLDYEAYEPMALALLADLARQARERFPVGAIAILHRLGRIQIGETSVLIVVASAHRAAAFEACRWIIDTLKKTVPIWKKEYFEDGAVWADGEPFPEEIRLPAPVKEQQPASK